MMGFYKLIVNITAFHKQSLLNAITISSYHYNSIIGKFLKIITIFLTLTYVPGTGEADNVHYCIQFSQNLIIQVL